MKIRNVKNKRATFVASMRTDTVFNTHAFCTSSEFAESPVYYDTLWKQKEIWSIGILT